MATCLRNCESSCAAVNLSITTIGPSHSGYPFFLPVKVLSRVFRGKFVSSLKQAFQKGDLCLPGALQPLKRRETSHSFLRTLFRQDWVVYAKPPFGGPEHVLHYQARYTHRVAISNHRLVTFTDGKVTFRWKDYAHGNKSRLMTLSASFCDAFSCTFCRGASSALASSDSWRTGAGRRCCRCAER